MFGNRNNKTINSKRAALREHASALASSFLELDEESSGIIQVDGYMIIDSSDRRVSLTEWQQNMDALPWANREPYIEINDIEKRQIFIAQFPAKLCKDSVVQFIEIHCANTEHVFQIEINQLIDNYLRQDSVDGSNNAAPDYWIRLRLPPLAKHYKFYKQLKKAGWPIAEQSLQLARLRDKDNNRA